MSNLLRVGRTIINLAKVVKVVRDGGHRPPVVTVTFENGATSTYEKNGQALWNYLKGIATDEIVSDEVMETEEN